MIARLAVAAVFALPLFAADVLAPWTLRSDFENGMRQGWESYPLAQDAGYDPTLDPLTYGGRKALERHKSPTRDGELRIGFIRKTQVTAGERPRLEFSYAIPSNEPARLDISIFAEDKPKVVSLRAETGGWKTASVALPVASPQAIIRAIAITAIITGVQEDRQERFLIDDVQLSAMRPRDLAVSTPAALWDADRRLHYAKRAYIPGDELRIATKAPATVRLLDPQDRVVAERKAGEKAYQFTTADKPGVWRVELSAGAEGTATILVLLRPAAQTGLLFDALPSASPDLLDLLRTRLNKLRGEIHTELGPNIAQYNERSLLPGLPAYFALLQPPSEAAVLEAMQYRHRNDSDSLAQAKKILLSMSEWPRWVHPWFDAHGYRTYYPVGIVAGHLAIAADLLRSKLSTTEMRAIENGLRDKSVIPAFEEYVINDRIAFNTSNWIGHAVGGALLGALVSSDRDVAGYALGLYQKQREHMDAAYTEDGSYGEGTSYMKFDMQSSALVAAAAKRHLGHNFDAPLIRSWKHLLYATYGTGEGLDHGDTHAAIRPFGVFAYAAAQNKDAELSRLYLANRDTGAGSLLLRLLWEAQIVKPVTPPQELPRSAVFPVRGNAMLRTGWDTHSTVVNMRVAANFNHNHADQGSLQLAHRGEVLMEEAGYSDYYKDPWYQPYVIQAAGHNVLLVDEDPESQILPGNRYLGDYPQITRSELADNPSIVDADLTPAYGGRVVSYTRTLVFGQSGTLVVVDRVKDAKPHRYSVLWHPAGAATPNGEGYRIRKNAATLDVEVFSPVALAKTSDLAPLPLAAYDKSEKTTIARLPVLRYTTAEAVSEVLIVSVLTPGAGTDAKTPASMSRRESGYEVKAGDVTVHIGPAGITAEASRR